MAKKKSNNFDLAYFKEYVRTYGEKENTDMYSNETIVKDMLYGIGLSLDKNEYKERSGFVRFMKWLAGITVCALMLVFVSCGDGKGKSDTELTRPKIVDKFDMSEIPCGELIGGTKPHMTIQTDAGEVMDVEVPEWVWDAYQSRGGERVGNCVGKDSDATTEPETSENEE